MELAMNLEQKGRISTAVLLLLIILTACATDRELAPMQTDPLQSVLPAIAQLDGLRAQANLNRDILLGKDTYIRSANAEARPGGELRMQSDSGTRCWAIWQIPDQPEYLDSIFVDIIEPVGAGCFVGLADYSTGRWQFSGPYTEQTSLPVPTDWQLSPGGNHYVAVMTHDGASVDIGQLFSWFEDGWQLLTIRDGNTPIQSISIAAISGRPAILWQEQGNPQHSYAISSSADGLQLADWTSLGISFGPGGAFGSDLQEINGRPAFSFSYTDFEHSSVLGYALSSSTTGSSPGHWSYFLLDEADGIGYHNSLALIGGKPAIAYAYISGTNELWYSRSSDAEGASLEDWSVPVRIDHDGSAPIGVDCSLAQVNGRPAVAYHADNRLRYAWSSSQSGEGEDDWNIRIIDSDGASTVGRYASLAVISGKPAVAYYDQFHADLKYAWSDTLHGQVAGDWTSIKLAGPPIAGQFVSLLELDGGPALCYHTVGLLNDLIFDQAATPQGMLPEDWGPYITVDDHVDIDPPDVGQYCDMALVNGNPAIAYYDATNQALKYAVRILP
jgi:hypothetical protein